MSKLKSLEPKRVFKYFEDICSLPHGSENTDAIAEYCISFAEKHSLKAVRDKANNVVIYKAAADGYEGAAPVILQGHIDMVCQKSSDSNIDFSKEGLDIFVDGDFVKAKGTTLGADNGIAIAMILAILESKTIPHPAIEAVFTSDEEIGMVGAKQLDMGLLSAKRMINIDSEEEDTLTVSCAGGSDFKVSFPVARQAEQGTLITVTLKGLKGGHSGVEINSGRINADILAGRFLNYMKNAVDFSLISIDGGDKSNAIPNFCRIQLCTSQPENFKEKAESYLGVIKKEFSQREPDFSPVVTVFEPCKVSVLNKTLRDNIIFSLLCVPNGVTEMSAEINGLVETSLNLGILETRENEIILDFSLRSNKNSAHNFLESRLKAFFEDMPCHTEAFGHYPPWEFKKDSELQKLYIETFTEQFGVAPKVEAIHAGLECGVFSSKINGLDCIAIGPTLHDVHTVNERLSISSAERIFNIILQLLKKSN